MEIPSLTTVVHGPADDLQTSFRDWLTVDAVPQITITMPVDRTWDQRQANAARLRARLDAARDEALGTGLSSDTVEAALHPATSLLNGEPFWDAHARGVALLLTPSGGRVHSLPFAPRTFSGVDDRAHLRPVWAHTEPDGPFYVLALSAGGSTLFRASRYGMRAVDLADDVPTSLDEAMAFEDPVRSVRYHANRPTGSSTYFGHEDAGDQAYVKERMLRFLRALDNGVRTVLEADASPAPLVLAGPDPMTGLYRKANHYPHVLDASVDGRYAEPKDTPDDEGPSWDAEALHRRAWALVQPHLDADRRAAADRYAAHPERTAGNVGAALLAAAGGRVDTLFVASEPMVWGTFDAASHTVQVHGTRALGDTELMNAAVAWTLRTGGTVYVTHERDVPGGTPIAAVLRY